MATPMTLGEKKFNNLMKRYIDRAEFVLMPCPKLVEMVESGNVQGTELNAYLREKLSTYLDGGVGSIVLGCTHFPFVKEEIKKIVGDIAIIDGSVGTVKQLRRQLKKNNILNEGSKIGTVHIYNSLNNVKMDELSNKLLQI